MTPTNARVYIKNIFSHKIHQYYDKFRCSSGNLQGILHQTSRHKTHKSYQIDDSITGLYVKVYFQNFALFRIVY